jgi:phosphate transport system protein
MPGVCPTDVRAHFEDQLRHVKSDVVRLAALVGECIPRGTEALITHDRGELDGLRDVVSDVERLAAAIEAEGCRLLALQQPVAGDLRALVTALRMAYELERVGSLVVDATSTIDGPFHDIDARARGLVEQLGELMHALLLAAVDAYVDGDASSADRLAPVLNEVIDVHHRLVDHLVKSAREGHLDVDAAVQFALVGRCYERAGEHALTIAHRVRYLVAGTERLAELSHKHSRAER